METQSSRSKLAFVLKQNLALNPGLDICQTQNLQQIVQFICPQFSHMENLTSQDCDENKIIPENCISPAT